MDAHGSYVALSRRETAAPGRNIAEDPEAELRKARTEALKRHVRAVDAIFSADDAGRKASPQQWKELTEARKAFDEVRPHGWQDAEAAYAKDADLAREAGTGKVNRAIRVLQLETEIRIDPPRRADRFVERWQKLDRTSQHQYREGDMAGYKATRSAMGEMAKSLERDPQLESILANRKRDLGISGDFDSGRSLGRQLAFHHGLGSRTLIHDGSWCSGRQSNFEIARVKVIKGMVDRISLQHDRKHVPTLTPKIAPVLNALMGFDDQYATIKNTEPVKSITHAGRWQQKAIRAHGSGEYADCVVCSAIWAETFLVRITAELMALVGEPIADMKAEMQRGIPQFLNRNLGSKFVKGNWDHTSTNTHVGKWYQTAYALRSRVVHEGYLPTADEAYCYETTHEFVRQVSKKIGKLKDPRLAIATRFFKHMPS